MWVAWFCRPFTLIWGVAKERVADKRKNWADGARRHPSPTNSRQTFAQSEGELCAAAQVERDLSLRLVLGHTKAVAATRALVAQGLARSAVPSRDARHLDVFGLVDLEVALSLDDEAMPAFFARSARSFGSKTPMPLPAWAGAAWS